MTIAIRELGINDKLMLEELLDVCSVGWSNDLAPGASGPLAFIADPKAFMFGAYIDNEPVGWLWGVHIRRPDGRMMSYVHQIDVIVEHRRKGVATSLLQAGIDLARRSGSHKMWLITAQSNDVAKALYERGGAERFNKAGDVCYTWSF